MAAHADSAAIVFIAAALIIGVSAGSDPKPVYFSFIVSRGEKGFNSSGVIPAIDLALETVQRRQLLRGYNLTYDKIKNSQCSRTDSLDVFFQDTQLTAVPKIAVVGCGCGSATLPVAEISHYWNITQISFASPSSELSDRARFQYHFRATPSFLNYGPSILGILNKYKWKQIAFITQNIGTFIKVVSDFQELQQKLDDGTSEFCCFENHNIVTENFVFDRRSDIVNAAKHVFDEGDSHVFFVNSLSKSARRIICEGSKKDLVYPHYAWIIYSWYEERWWTEEIAQDHIDCTDEDIQSFLVRARPLLIQIVPEPDDFDLPADPGMSTNEFISEYHERLQETGYRRNAAFMIAFDDMWTVAKVLNYTEEMRLQNMPRNYSEFEECHHLAGDLVPLNEFNYSNAFMGCVIFLNYRNINFTGVSGPITFDESGTIVYTRIRWAQTRLINGELERVRFGYLNVDSNFTMVYQPGESDDTVYPDGFPPDGIPLSIVLTYHTPLVVVYYILALCGCTVSVVLFTFNFIFRKAKVVRLTAPSLNYIIISGALLMYISVFIGLLPTTDQNVIKMQCIVHVWLYGTGYLLVYGTILAKMCRVYQIFHNLNPHKKILKNWHLVCIVVGVCGVGVLLFLTRSLTLATADPLLVANKENSHGTTRSAVREDYFVWQCYKSGSVTFICDVLIFTYLGLLQLVGIVLAFQTRKVKILILNDSKPVAALVYISSVALVMMVLIIFTLRDYINVIAAVFNGGIIVLATVFLIFIFTPKIIHLYRDPKGKEIFSSLNPSRQTEQSQVRDQQTSMVAGMTELNDSEKVVLLNSHVAKLSETLDIKTKRIIELEAIVNSST